MRRINLTLLPACALAIYGLVGQVLFLLEQSVPSWILIVSLASAIGLFIRFPPRAESPAHAPTTSPFFWGAAVILLGLFVWSAWTSCVTPDRSWDGLVSWSLRANALGSPADLSNTFYSEHEVFAHSRAYPLLQPLILASLGDFLGGHLARLLFPLLYLSIILLILDTGRILGASYKWALLIAMAAAWTPGYHDVGAGGLDSGYGDLFLAYAIAVGAAGLLLENSLCLFLACLLLPWIKPEGIVYAFLFSSVLAFGPSRRALLAAAAGLGLSLLLWLPVRARLSFSPQSYILLVGPAVTILLLLLHVGLQRLRSKKKRVLALGLLASLLLIAGILGRSWLAESNDLMLRIFATNLDQLPDRLSSLPALLLGFVITLFSAKTLGLVFVLLVPAFFLVRARQGSGGSHLWWFLCLSLLVFLVAILLSPERDLAHELRSRLARLVLQIVPAAWIYLTQVGALASKDPVVAGPVSDGCEDSEPTPSARGLG